MSHQYHAFRRDFELKGLSKDTGQEKDANKLKGRHRIAARNKDSLQNGGRIGNSVPRGCAHGSTRRGPRSHTELPPSPRLIQHETGEQRGEWEEALLGPGCHGESHVVSTCPATPSFLHDTLSPFELFTCLLIPLPLMQPPALTPLTSTAYKSSVLLSYPRNRFLPGFSISSRRVGIPILSGQRRPLIQGRGHHARTLPY